MIYLDSAATAMQKPESVPRAMLRAMRTAASTGRGDHGPAMEASGIVLDCRTELAELFHMPGPERVVFTMNATHALNLAMRSLVRPGARVLISGYEHNAVTRPLHALGAEVLTASCPLFDREACLAAFEKRIGLAQAVVCTHVSNVFGFILPLREIAGLCRERGIPLIVDASQSAGCLPLDQRELGAAFLCMPGHKGLLGPQGTGVLLCGERGEPLLYGGSGSNSLSQEMPEELPERLEAGTLNVTGVAGLLEGVRWLRRRGVSEVLSREQRLAALLASELERVPGLRLFRGGPESQTGVLSVLPGRRDPVSFASALAERGVCVRAGLHCAPLAHETAGTLGTGTVRFSVSPFNTEREIRTAALIVRELLSHRA